MQFIGKCKDAQQYTIESFNNKGEIVYSALPNKETHLTANDTILFIESERTEKLYARITIPAEIVLEEKSVFMQIFSKIKSIV